jgi:hypothetical protein
MGINESGHARIGPLVSNFVWRAPGVSGSAGLSRRCTPALSLYRLLEQMQARLSIVVRRQLFPWRDNHFASRHAVDLVTLRNIAP